MATRVARLLFFEGELCDRPDGDGRARVERFWIGLEWKIKTTIDSPEHEYFRP